MESNKKNQVSIDKTIFFPRFRCLFECQSLAEYFVSFCFHVWFIIIIIIIIIIIVVVVDVCLLLS